MNEMLISSILDHTKSVINEKAGTLTVRSMFKELQKHLERRGVHCDLPYWKQTDRRMLSHTSVLMRARVHNERVLIPVGVKASGYNMYFDELQFGHIVTPDDVSEADMVESTLKNSVIDEDQIYDLFSLCRDISWLHGRKAKFADDQRIVSTGKAGSRQMLRLSRVQTNKYLVC